MARYEVVTRETVKYTFTLEAESEDEADAKARRRIPHPHNATGVTVDYRVDSVTELERDPWQGR